MDETKPDRLRKLVAKGPIESYAQGQVFYALDFKAELYVVKKGYAIRYATSEGNNKVMESIYGPGYLFPLTPVYTNILHLDLSRENNTYFYEAMTDLELQGTTTEQLKAAVEEDPLLYRDLLYEAGIRLRANINRLASNAIKDEYKRVTHQLVYLAEEFGEVVNRDTKTEIKLKLPLTPLHMAEQLNISEEVAAEAFSRLEEQGLIDTSNSSIYISDISLLKDVFL